MILEAITSGWKAIAAFFGYAGQRSAASNTPEMVENLKNQREQVEKAKDVKAIEKAIKTDNLDDIRRRLS